MKEEPLNNIKHTGFKTPKGYFDNLDRRILSASNVKIKDNASGFEVPTDYFDSLEDHIINKVNDDQGAKVIPLFRKNYVLYIGGIAASVLLLLNVFLFNQQTSWEDVDFKTVENYVINENLGSYEIASYLIIEDLNETDFDVYDLDEDSIEAYLQFNAEIETLMIE